MRSPGQLKNAVRKTHLNLVQERQAWCQFCEGNVMEQIIGHRGNPLIVYEGFKFRLLRKTLNVGIKWRCIDKKCTATSNSDDSESVDFYIVGITLLYLYYFIFKIFRIVTCFIKVNIVSHFKACNYCLTILTMV